MTKKEMKKIARESLEIMKHFEREKKIVRNEAEYITQMKDNNNVVEFEELCTYFFLDAGIVKAVDGVTFSVPKGKTVGVVGESGCGKSVTSLSLMRLVQGPSGQIVSGQIRFNYNNQALDLTKVPEPLMRSIRGNDIAMIFQEPMTAMNPVFNTGSQIYEIIKIHHPEMTKHEVKARVIEMLDLVGIANPERIYKAYPHELSGGMRQRAMIAMALACDPQLIIADEPTTALDVTIQAQILDLLRNLKDKINASIMLITHDLGVVAEMADYVVVMYAGRIIEQGSVRDIYKNPKHPYTVGLIKSRPSSITADEKLYSIPGQVPNPINMPNSCYFKDRCNRVFDKCLGEYPPLYKIDNIHYAACWMYQKDVKKHE